MVRFGSEGRTSCPDLGDVVITPTTRSAGLHTTSPDTASTHTADFDRAALLDTHCHVDAFSDPMAVLRSAREAGVDIVAVTEDPGAFKLLRTRLGPHAGVVPALGCHPLRVGSLAAHELARFFRFLPQASWIGEIGLDFAAAGVATKKQQLQVFEAILAEPALAVLPVTVHSRGAQHDVISRLAQIRTSAILHWFTGSSAALDAAIEAGLWFSINPSMTRSSRASVSLRRLPRDRVLLETDGPYCRINGHPCAPADLGLVIRDLGRLWDEPVPQVRTIITANQERLFASCRR